MSDAEEVATFGTPSVGSEGPADPVEPAAPLSTMSTDEGGSEHAPPSATAATRRWSGPGAQRVAREAAILLAVYVLYGQVRNLAEGRASTAEAFAAWLLSVERSWGIDVELGLNQWVAVREPLAVAMNYYYAVLHMLVPVAVLAWLWRRHPGAYPPARTALVLGSLIALLGYWLLPLAPPRLLPELGYVDTFWYYDTWGSLSDPALARLSNQYAAMPSLHVGWALWAGIAVAVVSHRWWGRAFGLAYPVTTILVVLGTANHFILDAVGSIVVMGAGAVLALVWFGPDPLRPRPSVAAAATILVGVAIALLVVALRPPYGSLGDWTTADEGHDTGATAVRGPAPAVHRLTSGRAGTGRNGGP